MHARAGRAEVPARALSLHLNSLMFHLSLNHFTGLKFHNASNTRSVPFHSKPFILPNLFTFATSSIFNLRALPAHRPASPFHAHLLSPGSKQLAVRSVMQLLSSSTVFRIPYVHFLPHHLPHLIHPPQHFSLSLIPLFTPSSNPTSFSSPILLSCTRLSPD